MSLQPRRERQKQIKKRIKNGLSYFRNVVGDNYNSDVVKRYFPQFLNLIEDYLLVTEGRIDKTEKLAIMVDRYLVKD